MSIVTNHAGDVLARIDIFSPIRLVVNEIPLEISYEDREVKLNVIDEIAEKVTIVSAPLPSIHNRSVRLGGHSSRVLLPEYPLTFPQVTDIEEIPIDPTL